MMIQEIHFYAWLVDEPGVSNIPGGITTNWYIVWQTDYSNLETFSNNGGYMRASPNGTKNCTHVAF